ncbi:MAG: hypothetical protein ABJ308_01735 [Halieaceae bacterium]
MLFEELPRLLSPETLPYQSGVERLPNGILHVAVLTRMPGVTPRMLEWWFGDYLQTTEHYKRWHPRDHLWMAWEDKRLGTHVGAKHQVHEYIGGKLNKLRIAFQPPQTFFGEELAQQPDAVAICAYAGSLTRPVDVGRMVHLALPKPWGCELHSRFWLGYVNSRNDSSLVNMLGNLPWVRRSLLSLTGGRALEVHCHEEMTTLAGFLPELYAAERSSVL